MKPQQRWSQWVHWVARRCEIRESGPKCGKEIDDVGDEAQTSALKIGLIVTALVALTAVGTAATAPLIAGIMGLASSLGRQVLGFFAYGAVAVSVLGQVFESATQVDQIQEKIDNADSAKERIVLKRS